MMKETEGDVTYLRDAAKFLAGRFGEHDGWAQAVARAADHARLQAEVAKRTEMDGMSLVPTDVLDRFPEINPSNYDHDDACRLNSWGVELVLAAAQEHKN